MAMRKPSYMPRGPVSVTATVNAHPALNMLRVIEARLATGGLMSFLAGVVSPFMGDNIVARFAYGGDAAVGGPWPPLAGYTIRLKRSLGYPLDPNERTGEMMHHLAYDHAVEPWALGALLRIPDESDTLMQKKIKTAQEGESGAANPLGGATPPRPVLALSEIEEAQIDRLFHTYVTAPV